MKKGAFSLIGAVFLFGCLVPNAAAYVVFQEDFNAPNALDSWLDTSNEPHQYYVSDGVLYSDKQDTGSNFLLYQGGLALPNSYEVTFEGKLIQHRSGGGSDHLGVVPIFIDWNNFYFTSWRQNQYNDFPLWGRVGGTDTGEVGLVGGNAYNFDETVWHTITVIKDPTTISAYVNGDWMYTETVPELNGGTIGFFAQRGILAFDNLVITSTEPVPEPTTIFLLGSGLIGLAGYRIRFKRR